MVLEKLLWFFQNYFLSQLFSYYIIMNQSGHLKKHENEHVWKSKLLKIKNSILELEKDIRGVKEKRMNRDRCFFVLSMNSVA